MVSTHQLKSMIRHLQVILIMLTVQTKILIVEEKLKLLTHTSHLLLILKLPLILVITMKVHQL